MWFLCYILTATGALPDNPKEYGYEARTDLRLDVIKEVSWFRFPYPGRIYNLHVDKCIARYIIKQTKRHIQDILFF